MGLRLALVSTYPPRHCGIATFASHLRSGLLAAGADEVPVVAMLKEDAADIQRPEVIATIREEHEEDYREAARLLNARGYDAVLLQHEFGIFGGNAGSLVNELLDGLEIPVIATLHTILSEPAPEYRRSMDQLLERIQAAVVMAKRGGQILQEVYGFSPDRIFHIPHGVPQAPAGTPGDWKKRLEVDGRVVAMTFGLIGPGKGIETAIRAMSVAVSECPDLLYLIVGATHPEVLRKEGEQYRHSLERLVAELDLADHIRFVNRYLADDEVLGYLRAADLYISPYPGAQQITSGTLTYALAMGKAIISTPYTYAQELLAGGAGVLVPFNDWKTMGHAMGELARNPEKRESLSAAALARGAGFAWPNVGSQYIQLAERMRGAVHVLAGGSPEWDENDQTEELLTPSLTHLIRMTDDTGMIQHAIGPVPNRTTGYTSDDNARALLVALWAAEAGHAEAERLAETYLAFLAYALRPDRWFHNFFWYDRRAIPEEHSEDCQVRCLWALAAAARHWAGRSHGWTAARLFESGLQPCRSLKTVRGLAGLVLSGTEWLQGEAAGSPADTEVRNLLVSAADQLVTAWEQNRDSAWEWFENCLTYDNAALPFALLRASRVTGQKSYRQAGLATLEFLTRVTFRNKVFWPIGNRGWYPRGGRRADFDQQPLEAAMMVLACREAAAVTGDSAWMELAHHAAKWFVGQNALGIQMVDEQTGGCHDGLEKDGVNPNQGAESTLAWLMAAFALQRHPTLTSAAK